MLLREASPNLIKDTVTMELEQEEFETLTKALKVAPTTIQNYFSPHREIS
jgi:hypothetical protein